MEELGWGSVGLGELESGEVVGELGSWGGLMTL